MVARLLRLRELVAKGVGSRTSIWRGVKAGTFPAPTELGPNSIGWPEPIIDAYLAGLPRRTYGADTPFEAPEDASPAPPTAPVDKNDGNQPSAAD